MAEIDTDIEKLTRTYATHMQDNTLDIQKLTEVYENDLQDLKNERKVVRQILLEQRQSAPISES